MTDSLAVLNSVLPTPDLTPASAPAAAVPELASLQAEPEPAKPEPAEPVPLPEWDSMMQTGDLSWTLPASGARPSRVLTVRTSSQGSATASRIWTGSHVLFRHLQLSESLATPQTVLELGSGTGFLALLLAAAGAKRTQIIATEQSMHLRLLKYNANRNQLRHAIRCMPWDWGESYESPSIDWDSVTLCLGSDLVYYSESPAQERALAHTLCTVVKKCRPDVPILIMLRVRASLQPGEDGSRQKLRIEQTPAELIDGADGAAKVGGSSKGSAALYFIREVLPTFGLQGEAVPLAAQATSDPTLQLFRIMPAAPKCECAEDHAQSQSIHANGSDEKPLREEHGGGGGSIDLSGTESHAFGASDRAPELPPGLEDARDAAMNAYVRSESGMGGTRICNANNLSVYWSGADPFEAERCPPVSLPGVLTAAEVAACFAASEACGRREPVDAEVCTALAGTYYDAVYSDEHVACYLHRDGNFAAHCPAILEKLVKTMSASHPGFPSIRKPLHARCVELHAYAPGGALLDPGHRDNGSKRTLIVQLTNAEDFGGGRFVTWHEGEHVLHEMQLGDGLLINSEKMHNVAPVTHGLRNSLVIELWVAPANQYDRFR
jgi:predicted nicotinamide N-methyase/predicted 2-oxoglutarate/Fe(II)-dependent dioxygenase YbiX